MKKILPLICLLIVSCGAGLSAPQIVENNIFGKPEVSSDHLIIRVTESFDIKNIENLGMEIIDKRQAENGVYLYLKTKNNAASGVTQLSGINGVIYAQQSAYRYLKNTARGANYSSSLQYSRNITKLDDAVAKFGIGANAAVVAVIDSGINLKHQEFAGKIFKGFSAFNMTSSAGGATYSYVGKGSSFADMLSAGLLNWDGNPSEGHGSHVCGIIAADNADNIGISGVCPGNLKIVIFKSFADNADGSPVDGSASDWSIYGALYTLIIQKPAILTDCPATVSIPVNMSFGGFSASYYEADMIQQALEAGIVCIAASGNDSQDREEYPACYSGVISVGATDRKDEVAKFSTRSNRLSVCAPGEDILSVMGSTNDEYLMMSGTSMAAPFVTGLVGYMLTIDPDLTVIQIRSLLESCADDLGTVGYDSFYGYGRVNALKVISAVKELSSVSGASITLYDTKIVKVKVTVNGTSTSGIAVSLYDSTGKFISLSVTGEKELGIAYFNTFRTGTTGTYTVKASYNKIPKSTDFIYETVINPVINPVSITYP